MNYYMLLKELAREGLCNQVVWGVVWEGCVTSFVVGKIKKTQARPSAAPHRGAARPCGCVFFDFPSVFEVFCRLSHNYQQTLPGFVYYQGF